MACFVVPMGEAIITTVVQKVVKKREKKTNGKKAEKNGFTWSQKLGLLNKLLWGGSVLLAFEHLWHGEIVPWPPFLTAMSNPADIALMLHEMATFGTAMAVATTVIWGIIVLIIELKAKLPGRAQAIPDAGGIK
jgi:polyferredoxin